MKKLCHVLIIICLLTGCSDTVYEAQRGIAGTIVKIRMVHNHPFLAEYKRWIYINNGNPVDFGQDSGGYSFIHVFETPTTIILQTFHTHILIINKQDLSMTLSERSLDKNEEKHFIGKFNFDKSQGRREYIFIPSTIEPKFDSQVMKGG